jgi:hypothetical protein
VLTTDTMQNRNRASVSITETTMPQIGGQDPSSGFDPLEKRVVWSI